MIQKAKEKQRCIDLVAHWGKEMEPMPTEYEKNGQPSLCGKGC